MGTGASTQRRILVVDLDAFYASVERLDDPSLRGLPLVVAGRGARGVVAAASYEARAFGVRSAMPTWKALEACPGLVVAEPRHARYREVSAATREIFARHGDAVEPASLDEAYIDVTGLRTGDSATAIAAAIREEIRSEVGITASAGVSYNKFVAKLASSVMKPDGQYVVRPRDGAAFVQAMPVARLHGVGPATAARMEAAGLATGADLAACDPTSLERLFGRQGPRFRDLAMGIDERPVVPDRERRSVGSETTFERDALTRDEVEARLDGVVDKLWERHLAAGKSWRTVTLKLRYADFSLISRSRSRDGPVGGRDEVRAVAAGLLRGAMSGRRPVRLVGVTLSGEVGSGREGGARAQLDLALA